MSSAQLAKKEAEAAALAEKERQERIEFLNQKTDAEI